jgi:2-dehydro-3-deoxygluconokinase
VTGEVATFGEIMLRLSAPGNQRFEQARVFEASFAGAEANVAVSLANLGTAARFVTRLPANDLGSACLKTLRGQGVDVGHIVRGGERLGIFYVEAGAAQRGSKVIYDRAESSFATVSPGDIDWPSAFAGAGWFHWTGITPAVSQGAAEVLSEAVDAACAAGLTVSCDLNYRAKLWHWGRAASEVMPALVDRCDVAIGNEEDAEKVFGIVAPDIDVEQGKVEAEKYVPVIEQMVGRFPALRTVAFTLRGSLSASHNTWSALLWQDGHTFVAPTYDILPIVDRVGGGDAFAAGLIYGLQSFHDDPQRALDFAVAASCLAHTVPGDMNLVTVEEVERLASGHAGGRVAR